MQRFTACWVTVGGSVFERLMPPLEEGNPFLALTRSLLWPATNYRQHFGYVHENVDRHDPKRAPHVLLCYA
jgi:hypothetical protein